MLVPVGLWFLLSSFQLLAPVDRIQSSSDLSLFRRTRSSLGRCSGGGKRQPKKSISLASLDPTVATAKARKRKDPKEEWGRGRGEKLKAHGD